MTALLWLPSLLSLIAIHQVTLVADVNAYQGSRQGQEAEGALQGPLRMQQNIPDISWYDTDELFRNVPLLDHIVLFYIPLHTACRQFMTIFVTLQQQFDYEHKHVKFIKVNCNGADVGDNLCRRYNVTVVPTVVYVSSVQLQREHLPASGLAQRGLRWCLAKVMDDVRVPNATSYKGDLFLYQELKDWATLMYGLSQLKRRVDSVRQYSFIEHLRQLLSP